MRRRLIQPRFSVVMRDDRRRSANLVGETVLQRPPQLGMNALATAAQQRGVRSVLHQRMLENVNRFRRRAAAMDQFGRDELAERVLQRRALDRRYRFQQSIRELSPDRRADRRVFFDRRETVEPRHQRVLQSRGYREWGKRAVEDKAAVFLPQQP